MINAMSLLYAGRWKNAEMPIMEEWNMKMAALAKMAIIDLFDLGGSNNYFYKTLETHYGPFTENG